MCEMCYSCQLVDFHRPTSPDGGHPQMFKWVLQYFQRNDDFKPPLYLQHQGIIFLTHIFIHDKQ
jgi:hypothetical protein